MTELVLLLKRVFNNNVFRNFSYLSVGSILSQVVSLFTVIKITRILAPHDYGIYTFLMVQGTLILTISDLGLRNIVIRTIARNPQLTKDLTFNGALLRTIALVLFSLLYLVFNNYFGKLNPDQILLIFLFVLISCFSRLFEASYLGNQKMLPPALINLIFNIIWFVIIYLLPSYLITVGFLFMLFLLVNTVKALVYFICLKYQQLLTGNINNFWLTSKKLMSESWPYWVLVLIMLPFTHFSNNFLDLNSTKTEIGYFNLSERLIGPVSMVLDLALVAIFPNLSSLWVNNQKQFNRYVSVGFKYFLLIAMLFCFLFSLFIKEVIITLLPASYIPALQVCQLYIWYLFLTSIDSLIGTILGAINKEKLILKIGLVRSLLSTPILYYGSLHGSLGLAYGYVISFAVFQVFLWYMFGRATHIKIQGAGVFWLLSVILFVLSFLVAPHIALIYKAGLSISVLGTMAFYLLKGHKMKFAV